MSKAILLNGKRVEGEVFYTSKIEQKDNVLILSSFYNMFSEETVYKCFRPDSILLSIYDIKRSENGYSWREI